MRRLFIIRKDLHLTPGKLAAMVSHCAEAYWTNLLKNCYRQEKKDGLVDDFDGGFRFAINMDDDIWEKYVNGIFTKTICEARNMNQLRKVTIYIEDLAKEGVILKEGVDYGWINDSCKTELMPENDDGTTTVGVWFRPLDDEIAHRISKKYMLYRD